MAITLLLATVLILATATLFISVRGGSYGCWMLGVFSVSKFWVSTLSDGEGHHDAHIMIYNLIYIYLSTIW